MGKASPHDTVETSGCDGQLGPPPVAGDVGQFSACGNPREALNRGGELIYHTSALAIARASAALRCSLAVGAGAAEPPGAADLTARRDCRGRPRRRYLKRGRDHTVGPQTEPSDPSGGPVRRPAIRASNRDQALARDQGQRRIRDGHGRTRPRRAWPAPWPSVWPPTPRSPTRRRPALRPIRPRQRPGSAALPPAPGRRPLRRPTSPHRRTRPPSSRRPTTLAMQPPPGQVSPGRRALAEPPRAGPDHAAGGDTAGHPGHGPVGDLEHDGPAGRHRRRRRTPTPAAWLTASSPRWKRRAAGFVTMPNSPPCTAPTGGRCRSATCWPTSCGRRSTRPGAAAAMSTSTVGAMMDALGYDRDFAELPRADQPDLDRRAGPGPSGAGLAGDRPRWTPADRAGRDAPRPGATAKAYAADAAAARVAARLGVGVLVSVGGDIATAADAPPGRLADPGPRRARRSTVHGHGAGRIGGGHVEHGEPTLVAGRVQRASHSRSPHR